MKFSELMKALGHEDLNCITKYGEIKEYQDEFIFTIDDVNTSLREDAISMKEQDGNLHVNLYIVDAVDIFEQHKKLSQQARGNWFTGKQEMLSQESKKKLFSLNAQPEEMATKKVIVYELKFDKNNLLFLFFL